VGGAADEVGGDAGSAKGDQRDDSLGGRVSTESLQIPQVEYIYLRPLVVTKLFPRFRTGNLKGTEYKKPK
jgi:hypothetical protein